MQIVVCGRGNGESILVSFNELEWIVIDSFIHPTTKKPAAISYLESKGFQPSEVIKAIVITHSHEDHIKGISEVIKSTLPGTQIFISNALTTKEAIEYFSSIQVINRNSPVSGVKEFIEVLNTIQTSGRFKDVRKVDKGTVIYRHGDFIVEILSPSQADVNKSESDFLMLYTESLQTGISQVAKHRNPNNVCTAINIVNIKTDECIILGSDLEINNDPQRGWDSAIDSNFIRTNKCVKYFKIPHHGSPNGYHQYTWDNLINQSATCVLTTYNSSSLPRQEEITLFRQAVSEIYCATRPKYTQNKVLPSFFPKLGTNIVVKNIAPKIAYGHVVTEKIMINNQMQSKTLLYGDAIKL